LRPLFCSLLVIGCARSPEPTRDAGTQPRVLEPLEASIPDVASSGSNAFAGCGAWEVHFSPPWSGDKDGCEGADVKLLGEAQKFVVMQAYGFTSKPIIDQLVAVSDRGVDTSLVLDRSDDKETEAATVTLLLNHRVHVYYDRKHAIAHNKIIVVDGNALVTGSFNFTRNAADHNAENCFIVRQCQPIAAPYLQNYMMHQSHSEPVK
jgi:phosphatidylserine/phosphatidylglycerophosphate/cardiolipin synthase-like enzyme